MKTRFLSIVVGPVKKLDHGQLSKIAAAVHRETNSPAIARPGPDARQLLAANKLKCVTEDTAISLSGHVAVIMRKAHD